MSRSKPLPREAKLRANGLLDMHYSPAELAEELGIEPWEMYHKLKMGLPHTRDGQKNIWIHGPEVARWLRTFESKWRATERQELNDQEAYCLRCRGAVRIVDGTLTKRDRFTMLSGTCPTC